MVDNVFSSRVVRESMIMDSSSSVMSSVICGPRCGGGRGMIILGTGVCRFFCGEDESFADPIGSLRIIGSFAPTWPLTAGRGDRGDAGPGPRGSAGEPCMMGCMVMAEPRPDMASRRNTRLDSSRTSLMSICLASSSAGRWSPTSTDARSSPLISNRPARPLAYRRCNFSGTARQPQASLAW